jgi:hypothetical protein
VPSPPISLKRPPPKPPVYSPPTPPKESTVQASVRLLPLQTSIVILSQDHKEKPRPLLRGKDRSQESSSS